MKLNKKRVFEFIAFLWVAFFIATVFYFERNVFSITFALLSIPMMIPASRFVEKFVTYINK